MPASPPSQPQRRIGRFVLHEQLGRGAQATVWRAHDEKLDRDVALKLLDPQADTLAVEQWRHEARAVSRLAHPNIVPVFDADESSGQPHLVFELVRGRTLSEALRQDGAIPAQRAVQLMLGVLDALAAAHAEGIVHRDLKPSNILIDDAGRPRVMDFGIAARISDVTDRSTAGRIVGTPGYLSPEAALGAAPSPSMDLFSAGLVLAEMIAGHALVRERDPKVAIKRATTEDLALPADAPCDDQLRAVVRRALARDPSARHPSASAFREALAQATGLDGALLSSTDGAKATLEFLLRRMRFKSDFPALSNAVVRIQRLVGSDTESLGSLSNEILKDVALTNKLLRMVNSVHFNRSGGGTISTVSRAVALVGFAGIRNMALSLVLLEHMQDKQHASRLRDEFVRALMAGQLASELTPWNTDVEDAYLAALMQNLGRLLTEFYLPDEARAIRDQLVQAQPGRAMPTPHDIELASERVLGLGFEELGLGVAKSWALPDDLQHAMRRHPGAPPAKAAERGIERHRWVASMCNDMAAALQQLEPDVARRCVTRLAEQHSAVLQVPAAAICEALEAARAKLAELVPAMGIHVAPGTATHRMLASAPSASLHPTEDLLSAHALHATATMPLGDQGHIPAVQPSAQTADLLAAGVQDVMDSLAAESFNLNAVLRMIMETVLRALHLRRVVFCLRDPRSNTLTGRFGLGAEVDAVVRLFSIPLHSAAGQTADLFTLVGQKGADTAISDSTDARIRSRLPAWYRGPVAAPSFLMLPLVMKGATFALLYADASRRDGIVLGEREMSLVRTLRNQAVMAFKQAG